MLLTITYEGQDTQDLGYLLHKHPDRAQEFELSYGKAYVFYPEVSSERTTAALLLDIDPIDLAKGKLGSKDGGLFDYVNDRPYASTSFLSTAISRVFGTAMGGRCKEKQELADTPLSLTAQLVSLKDYGEEGLAAQLFEPLGYTVAVERIPLDIQFPEWGMSPYINLTIRGMVRLSELLNHLYVLIPVFDKQKHYYIAEGEIKKLLDHGEGWLAGHPYKRKIARRYFMARGSYARRAIDILLAGEALEDEEDGEQTEMDEEIVDGELSTMDTGASDGKEALSATDTEAFDEEKTPATLEEPYMDEETFFIMAEFRNQAANMESTGKKDTGTTADNDTDAENLGEPGINGSQTKHSPLNTLRLSAVKDAVLASGASTVIDLGCGECRLTSLLLNEPQIKKVTACDVSTAVLEKAAKRLRLDRMQPFRKNKLTLMQASLTYKDKRFEGFDCACVIEVIEHIEPMRIPAFERVLFEFAAPHTVILTTPNKEYNANYEAMQENTLRHGDHRFEWTREEFSTWTKHICERFGYHCEITGIGNYDEACGNPTQMGVFTKNGKL